MVRPSVGPEVWDLLLPWAEMLVLMWQMLVPEPGLVQVQTSPLPAQVAA